MYQLKKNVAEFDVVDGPCAGRKYRRGTPYAEIPPQEAHKFEIVEAAPVADEQAEAKGGKKR
jgi:hypothetical protein